MITSPECGTSGRGCGIGGWLMLKLGDLVDGRGEGFRFQVSGLR